MVMVLARAWRLAANVDPDLWQQPKPPEIDFELHNRLYQEGKTDEASQMYYEHSDRQKAWDESMRRAISVGHISPEEAISRGHRPDGHERDYGERDFNDPNYPEGRPLRGWQRLPDPLYHVTTHAPDVLKHGLKTRDELEQARGRGLGGGTSNTISFTTDPEIAQNIHRGIHEMRQVARGERTVPQMIDEAKAGTGAKRPFWSDITRGKWNYTPQGDNDPNQPVGLRDLLRGVHRHWSVTPTRPTEEGDWRPTPEAKTWKHRDTGETLASSWERDQTEDEKRESHIEFAKDFNAYRAHAGGHYDPLFFSSDAAGLKDVPSSHIQILRAHPKAGARGYPVSSMKEWRTSSGDAVNIEPNPVEPHQKFAAGNKPFGAPLDEVMSEDNQDVISGGNPHFKSFGEEEQYAEMEKQGAKEVTHAGLALMAKDTGRVLTLQRALSDKDPASGKFEFPGGGIEEGESPIEGAIREWKEETGSNLPPGQVTHDWLSNGMYRGFVYVIPEEKALEINGSPGDREVLNPDDPDQDNIEVVLWMHPKDLKDHPATRKEVKSGTDWSVFAKARRKMAANPDWEEYKRQATDWADHVRVRSGHLENPRDQSLSWHHGSPARWGEEPEDEDEEGDYDGWEEEPHRHWNTYLGTHWTSIPHVAEEFARGKYEKSRTLSDIEANPGQVYTAQLGIKNPKVYRSESDMDKEAYHHAWESEDTEAPHSPGMTDDYPDDVKEHYDQKGRHAEWLNSHPEADNVAGYFKQHLQSQGHDGIVYGNEVEGPEGHPCAITFDEGQHHNVQRRWANQPHHEQGRLFEASDRIDYGMGHSPNEDGPPVHDLTGEGSYAPDDFYTHMHYYRTGDDVADAESMAAIRKAKWDNARRRPASDNSKWRERGLDFKDYLEESEGDFNDRLEKRKAGEHFVTVYRAAPKGAKTINNGDWVSLSRSYARGHSKHPDDRTQDMPVYEARVKAKHVRWPADSINEFGYFGPEAKATVRLRGGKNAPRVEPRPREGAMKLSLAQHTAADWFEDRDEPQPTAHPELSQWEWWPTHTEQRKPVQYALIPKDEHWPKLKESTGEARVVRDPQGNHLWANWDNWGEHLDPSPDPDVHRAGSPEEARDKAEDAFVARGFHRPPQKVPTAKGFDQYPMRYQQRPKLRPVRREPPKRPIPGRELIENLPAPPPPPMERLNAMKLHLADEEIVVPRNIDTLRDSTCAVCGSVDSMNGDRCTVCGYMATPQAFQSPDTSLAPKVRDQLGIGNPDSDSLSGAPDSGLEGPPGAEEDLEGMGEPGEGDPGLEDGIAGADLICDNCGSEFNSQEEEEDLSQPYMSPASRVEPDVSALGVEDEMEVAREVGQAENEAGTNEDVAYQEGDECPVCGEGILVPFEGEPEIEGMDEGEPGPNDFGGEAVGGVPEEEGPVDEQEEPEEEGAPGEEERPHDREEAPPDEEEDQDVVPSEGEDEPEEPDEDGEEEDDGPPFRRQRKGSSTMAVTPGARRPTRAPVRTQGPPPRQPAQRPAPRQATAAPNPAAQERRRLFAALEAQTAAINRQADRLQAQDHMLATMGRFVRQASTKISELSLRNETLERQMALVANASGLMEPLATIGAAGQARVAALYHKANPSNPAQPVPEPPSEPPVATSGEAMQSEGRDDVTQLGATPVANVSAAETTAVDLPYGELANEPVGMNRTDVTAPVSGTETATPPEMTVIPVDARIGNPDNPQVAFPFTVGPVGAPSRPFSGPSVGNPPTTAAAANGQREPGVAVHPQAQAHYIASVNLARLRAQVGITNEEPFQLGTKIAASMNDAQINAEAQGLQAVASRQATQPQPQYFAPGPAYEPVPATGIPDARPMVPHMAAAPGSSVLPADPSFQAGKYGPGPGSALQGGSTIFAPRPEEFGWDSPL